MKKRATKKTRVSRSSVRPQQLPPLTFMGHIRELQGRLFWIALSFVLIGGAAYPVFDKIVRVIVAPLGNSSQLVYLTPGGAFGFVIQVCMFIGAIGALPVAMYHLYKFIAPTVKHVVSPVKALSYVSMSLLLACTGIAFAYFVSLPAALYFLTNFNLTDINPMLTIDSYFTFVMSYLLAGALLFQLPLIIAVINSVKPLQPKKLMNYQRHMIVGSFIFAAVISPTPDAVNQTILALPPIVMYQLGIIWVMVVNRKAKKAHAAKVMQPMTQVASCVAQAHSGVSTPVRALASQSTHRPVVRHTAMDIFSGAQVVRRPVVASMPAKPITTATKAQLQPRYVARGTDIVQSPRSAFRAGVRVEYRQNRARIAGTRARNIDGFYVPARKKLQNASA